MPTAKALGGLMAVKFDRKESIGFDLVHQAQLAGLIAKGAGGGFGAAPATSADAVLLYLAFHAERGARQSIEKAAQVFGLRPLPSVLKIKAAGADGASFQSGAPSRFECFGHNLAAAIAAQRAHRFSGDTSPLPDRVALTQDSELRAFVAEIQSRAVVDGTGPAAWELCRYGAAWDAGGLSPAWHEKAKTIIYGGECIVDLADLLGPLDVGERDSMTLGPSPLSVDPVSLTRELFLPHLTDYGMAAR